MVNCEHRDVCRYADTERCLECENNGKRSYFEPIDSTKEPGSDRVIVTGTPYYVPYYDPNSYPGTWFGTDYYGAYYQTPYYCYPIDQWNVYPYLTVTVSYNG